MAELDPVSGRQAQAKATALRALVRLNGAGDRELTEAERHTWDPDRDPNSRCDRDDWHPSDDPVWIELDLHKPLIARRRAWMNLYARRGR